MAITDYFTKRYQNKMGGCLSMLLSNMGSAKAHQYMRFKTGGIKVNNIKRSLEDLLGKGYCSAVSLTAKDLHGLSDDETNELITDKQEFYSDEFSDRQEELSEKIGEKIFEPFDNENTGAPTISFAKAANKNASPIGGIGSYRVGEDGRLYLASKSEHYHTPVGHNFPGFKLIDNARKLGISNATHNNTRGYITRTLERELVRTNNGIAKGDDKALKSVLESTSRKVLNRVINLETGSLACEAGIKMMLARFYKLDSTFDKPKYSGKTPVFFVMADNDGGSQANYHGTTTIAQTFRGMWPEIYDANEKNGIYKVVSITLNDINDFEAKIEKYNQGNYKTAGFLHEIILMNYGGIRLTEEFLSGAYELCEKYDTPTMVDEIQSCMWYEGMYLYLQYGLKPDFVILGKGFSGGEYPASKIVTTYEMDSLNQFGALVTNGQEELASLAFLITMEFAQENGKHIVDSGNYFESGLVKLAKKYNAKIDKVEGQGHLIALHFKTVDDAVDFAGKINNLCMDISAQTYKANCPPAALLKPPIILSKKTMDIFLSRMDEALQ